MNDYEKNTPIETKLLHARQAIRFLVILNIVQIIILTLILI